MNSSPWISHQSSWQNHALVVKLNNENGTNKRLVTKIKEQKGSLEKRLVNLSGRPGNAEVTLIKKGKILKPILMNFH